MNYLFSNSAQVWLFINSLFMTRVSISRSEASNAICVYFRSVQQLERAQLQQQRQSPAAAATGPGDQPPPPGRAVRLQPRGECECRHGAGPAADQPLADGGRPEPAAAPGHAVAHEQQPDGPQQPCPHRSRRPPHQPQPVAHDSPARLPLQPAARLPNGHQDRAHSPLLPLSRHDRIQPAASTPPLEQFAVPAAVPRFDQEQRRK